MRELLAFALISRRRSTSSRLVPSAETIGGGAGDRPNLAEDLPLGWWPAATRLRKSGGLINTMILSLLYAL